MLFGFSQGCLMTIEVGLRYPHLFAGLVGISGYVHQPERLLQELSPVALQQRFLITHGTDDPLIPFGPVREQVNRLIAAGIQIEWHEFAKAHTIAGEEELAVIRDFVRACLFSDTQRFALSEDEHPLSLAQPVWEDEGAAQLLLGVASVQPGANVQLNGLVELGIGHLLEERNRFFGLVVLFRLELFGRGHVFLSV